MRNRFDELAKQIGERALAPYGATTSQHRISPETQFADLRHEPDPSRNDGRERLGLLGRIASRSCLIEAYSRAPGGTELRACLVKHLAFWQEREREGNGEPPDLWIIAAGTPKSLLAALRFRRIPSWPRGVYQLGGDVLRVHLVIVGELPNDPATLLVRLMAGGPHLAPAIRELIELPVDSTVRIIAEPVLLNLKPVFEQLTELQPDEKEELMAVYTSFEQIREEGHLEGLRRALRKVLATKFGPLATSADAQISNATLEELDRYLERGLTLDSVAAVLESEKS